MAKLYPIQIDIGVHVTDGRGKNGVVTISAPYRKIPTDDEMEHCLQAAIESVPDGFRLMTRRESEMFYIRSKYRAATASRLLANLFVIFGRASSFFADLRQGCEMRAPKLYPMRIDINVHVTDGKGRDGVVTMRPNRRKIPTDDEMEGFLRVAVESAPAGFRLMTMREFEALRCRAAFGTDVPITTLSYLEDGEEWHDPETADVRQRDGVVESGEA